MNDAPRVSVLVATKDRPTDLARLIPTLLAQDEPCFQLVIVDQSKDDATARIMQRYKDSRVDYVRQPATGKSKALNLGLRMCRGSVIAFTDDDCTVPNDWLCEGLRCLERVSNAGLVFGPLAPIEHDAESEYVPSIHFSAERTVPAGNWRSPGLIGMGANMFARRVLFEAVGGFDEDLGPGGRLRTGEECELAFRALRSGFSILQAVRPTVTHWGVRTRRDGTATRLITDGFFAMGAGYGKHLSGYDLHAAFVVIEDSVCWTLDLALAVIRLKRPFHVRRIVSYWKGVVAGIPAGPNAPVVSERLTERAA